MNRSVSALVREYRAALGQTGVPLMVILVQRLVTAEAVGIVHLLLNSRLDFLRV